MIKVSTSGFKELEAKLRDIEKKTTRRTTGIRALMKAGEPMAERARLLAPKEEGDLERAIKLSPVATGFNGRKGRRGGSGGQYGDTLEVFLGIDLSVNRRLSVYSRVQEEGNGKQPAQPYMRPAFESQKMQTVDRIRDQLRIEIDKAIGRQVRKRARLGL